MSEQFTCEDYFTPYSGEGTSEEAAISMRGIARTLRAKVHSYIQSKGKYGATDQEIQDGLSLTPDTQRPRRWELYREGKICKAGIVRKTISNRDAEVWISKEFKDDNCQVGQDTEERKSRSPRDVHEDSRSEGFIECHKCGRTTPYTYPNF